MPLIIADRVLESSTTTGTGVFTLTGASLGFRSFASVCSVADTVWYYIEGVTAFGVPSGEYEYGLGTYSGANQITRTTVRGSSNGGSPVNFSAGTKLVGIAPLAPDSSAAKGEWRAALSVASSGANTDITAMSGLTGNLTSTGQIGVGTSTPTNQVHVEGTSSTVGATQITVEGRYFGYGAGVSFQSRTSAGGARVEMARVTADGEAPWNTTASTQDAGLNFYTATDGSLTIKFRIRSDGAIYTGAAVSSPYNLTTASSANVYVGSDGILGRSTSSIKYKTNVQDYQRGLSAVMALRPVTYQSKGSADIAARSEKAKKLKENEVMPEAHTFAGFIAEEVHAAGLTEFVQYADDGTPDALGYAQMTALLVKAIQEQQAMIAALQATVAKLTNR